MLRIKYSIIILFCVTLASVGFWYTRHNVSTTVARKPLQETSYNNTPTVTPLPPTDGASQTIPKSEIVIAQRSLQLVPFTSQAPFGEWSDSTFQDGCEEASMTMTMAWVQGTVLTPESGKSSIEDITQFEIKKFGTFMSDTSAEDTAQIMRDYYHYDNMTVLHDASIDAIKSLLVDGALVMAPMNGQSLHNPNFTQPGPLHHMLIIIGYDAKTHEFITNDPGTRKGGGYRYDEKVLYQALHDYPTSNTDQPIAENQQTIIVVKK